MEAIKFQLIDGRTDQPLPEIYTALVKPGESFEASKEVALRRCQSMVIEIGESRMQPRRIRRCQSGVYQMAYCYPKGKSWSQGMLTAEINVVEII